MEGISVYADASALIGLARIDRLGLLTLLRVPNRVTTVVWEEIAGDPARLGVPGLRNARDVGLLAIVAEGDAAAFPQLDPGESTVLSAAAAVHAAVLLDERKARGLFQGDAHLQQSIRASMGIVGLVLLAKRRAYIAAVRPVLDALTAQSFRISPTLYEDALRAAGEVL